MHILCLGYIDLDLLLPNSSPIPSSTIPSKFHVLFLKTQWVPLMLPISTWYRTIYRSKLSAAESLKKTGSLSFNSRPLPIATQLGAELCDPPTPFLLGLWLDFEPISYVWSQPLGNVCNCFVASRALYLCSHPLLLVPTIFLPLFWDDPSPNILNITISSISLIKLMKWISLVYYMQFMCPFGRQPCVWKRMSCQLPCSRWVFKGQADANSISLPSVSFPCDSEASF